MSKPTPSPQDSAFKARTSAGQVAAKLNEHVAKPAAASAAVAPPVKLLSEPLAQPFRSALRILDDLPAYMIAIRCAWPAQRIV